MTALRSMFGKKSEEAILADRQLRALRSRLNVENIGLRREKIMLRTKLITEMLEGPERPKK